MKIGVIANKFIMPFPNWEKYELFRLTLYIFLLLNTISLLPIASEIFGYDGLVGTRGWRSNIPWYYQGSYGFLNVLSHPWNLAYTWIYKVFLGGQIIFLMLGILNILPKMSSILIYFFTANLFLKGYLAFTGGEVLVNILLFYMMFIHQSNRPNIRFIDRSKPAVLPVFNDWQNLLNNTFYVIIIIQIFVLYFFSTFYKLIDNDWMSGYALMYISQIESFSNGMMKNMFKDNYLLSAIATYTTLAYQILFPIVVWVKKVKIPFLILGVILHVSIAIGMGIFTFGCIMIITYILFIDNARIHRFKEWFIRKVKSIT